MGAATISVIMPVYNAAGSLSASVASLIAQQFDSWELVAVDDGSTDGSNELLAQWAARDPRIKVLRMASNQGPSAARNAALRAATGDFIAYLDADDEFYPDFLATVDRFRGKGDVLIFGYDVLEEKGTQQIRSTWDPTPYREILFAGNLATPLGIAHRRALGEQVGGFNDELWALEDWDFLKRMARAGAEFLFLPFRSGLYHKREGSRSRSPRLTETQRSAFMARRDSGLSLYDTKIHTAAARLDRKILILTPVFPFGSRSATAEDAAGVANLLASSGAPAQGFCVSKLDAGRGDVEFEAALSSLGLPFQEQETRLGPHAVRMIYTRNASVPVTIMRTSSTAPSDYVDGEPGAVLDYFEQFLATFRPDVLFAANPGPKPDILFDLTFHMAKSRDMPVALWLDDVSAINLTVLQSCDYCIVNWEHLRRRYWDTIGLVCRTLPPALDWDRLRSTQRDPAAVTILAAATPGESRFAARIIEKLARLRPYIPVAAVRDGKLCRETPRRSGVPAATAVGAATCAIPPDVHAVTKVLLVPSLGHGSFDRTTAEAMALGIPVLVSDRGALPEIVGDAGAIVGIPARYSAEQPVVPSADDIQPWVDAVIQLWDDPHRFEKASEVAAQHALRWHPERVFPIYAEFLHDLCPQPGPPLIPRGDMGTWRTTESRG